MLFANSAIFLSGIVKELKISFSLTVKAIKATCEGQNFFSSRVSRDQEKEACKFRMIHGNWLEELRTQ